ncbi:MAG: DUF3857 domain-containing transglutaminase family protein [Candidatus Aminicenantia bacterium]
MRKIKFISYLLIFFSSNIFSQNIEELIKRSPSSTKYPGANSAILYSSEFLKLDEDGSKREEFFRIIKIFNVTGREKFSDFRIPFIKDKEKIELIMGRTYKSDLSFVDVEKGAINDVTPLHLADAEIYSNLMHRVVSFPAVEPLKFLAIHYIKESTERERNIEGIVYFQTDEPVLKKDLKILIPEALELKYRIYGLEKDFSVETENNLKTYKISVSDSQQIKEEEFMPSQSEIASRIVFSTYKDWKDAVSSFSESFYKAILPTERVKEFTEKLIKGCSTEDEKIKSIFNFVAKEIRNVELDFGEGGYEVHNSDVVLRNRYGDWKDKSALLVSMLESVGIKSFPVLANKEKIEVFRDVPAMKQFNIVLVAIPNNGDYIYLSPFSNDSHFGYFSEGKDSDGLIVRKDGVEFREIHCLEDLRSFSKNEISGEIDEKGNIKGKISAELSGIFDKMARSILKDKTAKEREQFFNEAVNRVFDQGKSISYKISDLKNIFEKAIVSQEFSAEKFAIFQGNVMLLRIPGTPFTFANLPVAPRLSKRNYPFAIPDMCEVINEIKLLISGNFKPLYLPEEIVHKKDFGEFELSVSYDGEKSELKIKRRYLLLKREISVKEYDEFKSVLDSFGLEKNRLILLERR